MLKNFYFIWDDGSYSRLEGSIEQMVSECRNRLDNDPKARALYSPTNGLAFIDETNGRVIATIEMNRLDRKVRTKIHAFISKYVLRYRAEHLAVFLKAMKEHNPDEPALKKFESSKVEQLNLNA